jgi:hypothetical protein
MYYDGILCLEAHFCPKKGAFKPVFLCNNRANLFIIIDLLRPVPILFVSQGFNGVFEGGLHRLEANSD